MSSRTFILIRNTILTAVYAWLTWGFQQKGNNEAVAMGLTAIASLWVHSGRDKSRTSGGLSVLVPMTCALTLLSACEFQGGTVRLGPASPVIIQPGPVERLRAEYRAPPHRAPADRCRCADLHVGAGWDLPAQHRRPVSHGRRGGA